MKGQTFTPQNVIASVAIVAGLVSGLVGGEMWRGPTYPKPAADEAIRGLSAVIVRQQEVIAQQQVELAQCRTRENPG